METFDFFSFRDPAGVVVKYQGRILRLINQGYQKNVDSLLTSPLFSELVQSKTIPSSRIFTEDEFQSITQSLEGKFQGISSCIEHEAIPFQSYPYEWAPEMLHCAGLFTIDLAARLLNHNLGLKDATPYNISFLGPNPLFIDILSFEPRDPHDMIWLPYAQFVRTFLLPLIANLECDIALNQIFMHKSDGLEPEDVYRLLGFYQLFKPGIFSLVTLSSLFGKLNASVKENTPLYKTRLARSREMADFVLRRLFKQLKKALNKFEPTQRKSEWKPYYSMQESYSSNDFAIKNEMISKILKQISPKFLLDVGCNTGHFSLIAAKQGSSVVAIDSDSNVVGALWREAKKLNYTILPLVVDICRPSPAAGWNNAEQLSFLHRAHGAFDTVMLLAILHHMTITARIPLEHVATLCSQLTSAHLIIEFISPEDPMFRRLVRGRDLLYTHLTRECFERAFLRFFRIISCEKIGSSCRWLYYMGKNE